MEPTPFCIFQHEPFNTPGPGTYRTEKIHPPNERIAPRYSLSARTRFRRIDNNPAPNVYKLPSSVGDNVPDKHRSPSYSLKGRTTAFGFAEDLAKTPGPAGYRAADFNLVKRKSPQYSLGPRCYCPTDSTKKPGPGAHYPEKVGLHLRRSPSFSMGIRHSEYTTPLIIDVGGW